jgi:hypothetical protein
MSRARSGSNRNRKKHKYLTLYSVGLQNDGWITILNPEDTEEVHVNLSQSSRSPPTILEHYRYASLLDDWAV